MYCEGVVGQVVEGGDGAIGMERITGRGGTRGAGTRRTGRGGRLARGLCLDTSLSDNRSQSLLGVIAELAAPKSHERAWV